MPKVILCTIIGLLVLTMVFVGYSTEYKILPYDGVIYRTSDVYLRPMPMINWNISQEKKELEWLRTISIDARGKLVEGPVCTLGYRDKLIEKVDFKELANLWFNDLATGRIMSSEMHSTELSDLILNHGLFSEKMFVYWSQKVE